MVQTTLPTRGNSRKVISLVAGPERLAKSARGPARYER